jgi:hypothetical protein
MSPEIGIFGTQGPQVMRKAEISKDQESQILTKARVWTLKQPQGRVHTDPEAIIFSAGKEVKGTVQKAREPKIFECTPEFADGLKETGIIFSSTVE